jgi:hypothetical protein
MFFALNCTSNATFLQPSVKSSPLSTLESKPSCFRDERLWMLVNVLRFMKAMQRH